jgi:trimethylamine--corrinoid protein Co-methyltransferase
VRRSVVDQPAFAQPRLGRPATELVGADHLEAIHDASLVILRDVGVDFLHAGARQMLAAYGADVVEERVRFDPAMIEELVAGAPPEFTLHGRLPGRDVVLGGDRITFSSVASAPNYVDLDGRRRTGDRDGYRDFLRLGQMLNTIHVFPGYPVEPVDLDPATRHLEAAFDAHTLTDRAFHVYSLGRQRNLDGIEMARIARGVDDDTLEREPSLLSIINASSPLRYDTPMLEGVIQMSARNQVIVITPFTLAGAMAPITLAGALAQQNAEALAGIAFTQIVRRGAPVVYGGFTSNVDMRSGSPAFGTPENAKASVIGGQLARRYHLPYRSSGVSASNAVDSQAAYETMWSLWGAVEGGANLVMHAAGWMEGGLHASFEKMVVDADLLNMVSTFLTPVEVTDDTLAVDVIAGVGPGGHFFGQEHTQARFATEFYEPMISDWRNWESWADAGAPRADQRANRRARELLAAYEAPPIDDAVRDELREYVDRRIAEGGATDA